MVDGQVQCYISDRFIAVILVDFERIPLDSSFDSLRQTAPKKRHRSSAVLGADHVHQQPETTGPVSDSQSIIFGPPKLGRTWTSSDSPAQRTDAPWIQASHAQMISLGGAIGTSLFIGTAPVLRVGGPGFLLAYGLLSIMVYGIVTAIAEVGTYLPVPGGTMSYYGNKYVSRSLGFAMGYLYWYSLGILVPYELVAVNLLFNYWPWGPSINPAVWITVLLLVIVALNCLPARAFGEAEFWSAGLKILLILGLIFPSVVLFFGGGPNKDMLGFRYWRDPGATKTYLVHDASAGRFVSFLQAMVLSSFAFVLAPEYLIVTAGEMQSPRRTLPRADQHVWVHQLDLLRGRLLQIQGCCRLSRR
ncbi:putative proline-specific permease put4 [Colletotrichum trifolii]|uniref:Putative proline-specific permease put4 n=1 Tax=Colletotrichum trifolii TaxID=5466 RepID=A0A4R8QWD9_COLTR|nr:putative proline-specific permease put4 [Colletotrichum trifolii]